jgi:D-3-phosphoglycerate dehydrogenase
VEEEQRRPSVVYIGPEEGLEATVNTLDGLGQVIAVGPDQGELAEQMAWAVAVVDASTRIPVTADMIQASPGLRIISCASTGSSHVDVDAAAERGIEVRTLREDTDLLRDITPAAEHTWALVLACARQLPAAVDDVRSGSWTRESFPGVMLRGKTLGLIGCGRIGQWVARYATAFGMQVVGHDPHVEPWPDGIERCSLAEVAERADVLSVHVHLSPETHHLVDRELLALTRPGVIVVNTSRGGVVDEGALLDALEAGHVRAAGLDVLESEPDVRGSVTLAYAQANPNLIVTPHIGGFSPDAVRLVCGRASEKVADVLRAST